MSLACSRHRRAGPQARASDLLRSRGADALRRAIRHRAGAGSRARPPAQMIGRHPLRDGSLALGIALALRPCRGRHARRACAPRRAARRAGDSAGARPRADVDRRVAGARRRSRRRGRRTRLHRRCRRSAPPDRRLPGRAGLRVGLHRRARARRRARPAPRADCPTASRSTSPAAPKAARIPRRRRSPWSATRRAAASSATAPRGRRRPTMSRRPNSSRELAGEMARFACNRRGRPWLSPPICATAPRSTSAPSPSSAPRPTSRASRRRKRTSPCA